MKPEFDVSGIMVFARKADGHNKPSYPFPGAASDGRAAACAMRPETTAPWGCARTHLLAPWGLRLQTPAIASLLVCPPYIAISVTSSVTATKVLCTMMNGFEGISYA